MFYSRKELLELGLKSVGSNVLLSKRCSLYSPERISLGNNVRIDDFVILSASCEISIGNYVHIGAHGLILGSAPIRLGDFCGISGRVSLYSSSDDYSGLYMTNPMVPDEYRGVESAEINMGRHSLIGAGSTVLPGTVLGQGAAIGAMSLARGRYDSFSIYSGVPAKYVGKRQKRLLKYEGLIAVD